MSKDETPTKSPAASKLLEEMVSVAEHATAEAMTEEATPQYLAVQAVTSICFTLGGMVIYLPRGKAIERQIRNKAIMDSWKKGVDVKALARQHRVALQTVYAILSEHRSITAKDKG